MHQCLNLYPKLLVPITDFTKLSRYRIIHNKMESYVFDIILITLAGVILLHLVYNDSLLVKSECEARENMSSLDEQLTQESLTKDQPSRIYDDGKYRDETTTGLDRTLNKADWYHVANKLVTNDKTAENIKDAENIERAIKVNQQQNSRYENTTIEGIPPNNLPNIAGKYTNKIDERNRRAIRNKKRGRLVFDDNYEGRMSSDPFDADEVKIPATFGPRIKYSDETYVDVYGNECSRSENDLEIKRYIRDYVLDGTAQCGCVVDKSKSDFTRDEVDEYREQALQFRDKINGTSAPTEDPVDRMNKITLRGGIKAKGQTIADFYDNVVGGRVSNLNGPGFIMGTSVPANRCVKAPVFDNDAGVPQGYYTGDANAGGRYMLRDNWMYSNENPNNGGVFFDGITANDPFMDNDRMIDE